MTVQCCKCSNVRTEGKWHTPKRILEEPVSHTYCPECYQESLEEMRREQALMASYELALT